MANVFFFEAGMRSAHPQNSGQHYQASFCPAMTPLSQPSIYYATPVSAMPFLLDVNVARQGRGI